MQRALRRFDAPFAEDLLRDRHAFRGPAAMGLDDAIGGAVRDPAGGDLGQERRRHPAGGAHRIARAHHQLARRHDVADPQSRPHRLRQAGQINRIVGRPMCDRRPRLPQHQAHQIVLDQVCLVAPDDLGDGLAPRRRHDHIGRILQAGHAADHPDAVGAGAVDRLRHQPVPIDRQGLQPAAEHGRRRLDAGETELFTGDAIARAGRGGQGHD